MKIIIGAVVAVLILALGFYFRHSLYAFYTMSQDQYTNAEEVPQVLAKLSTASGNPAFATFMFAVPDKPNGENGVNIQFSLENGKPGFDWVLMAPRNIADQTRYVEFAKSKGFTPKAMEQNGVKYFRVEDGDLAALCYAVITEFYGIPKDATIGLLVSGFDWQTKVPVPK